MTVSAKIYDARRINAMALAMSPSEIASVSGLSVMEVIGIIRRDSKAAYWVARCNKTGREVRAYTERGAYFQANLKGFTDYELFGVPKGVAHG